MAKFCPNCGNLLDDDEKFCGNCGAEVEDVQPQEKIKVTPAEKTKPVTKVPPARKNLYASLQRSSSDPRRERSLLEKYFSVEGRLNRWNYFLRIAALWFFCGFIGGIFTFIFPPLFGVFAVILLISSLMLGIRRLHDLNRSGWLVLVSFIPLLDIIFGFYLLFAKGTTGENDYGPDPLALENNPFF